MSLALEGGFVTHEINKVSWFVKFPSHWNLVPAKRLFPESKERAQESDEQLSATQEYGVIPQSEFMRLAGRRVVQLLSNIELRKRVEVDDFVISMRSFQGGLERAWACGGIRSSYVVLRPVESVYVGYYQFLFKSDVYIQALQSTANFIRDGQDMNYQNFVLIDLPYPPYEEQRQIAAFLQHEITKIDSLIAEQEKLIALLKEKRQAVISHAVTKGLNPDAPMKDSGVEWLGQVPEHWELGKIKNLSVLISKGTTPSTIGGEFEESGIRFLKAENIGKGFYALPQPEFFISKQTDEQLARSRLEDKDILVIIAGATTGQASLITEELLPANTNQAVSFIRPLNKGYSEFIVHWLSTEYAQSNIWQNAVQAAQPNLSMETLGNIRILIPPKDEVVEIVTDIHNQSLRFADLISNAEMSIQLMEERRSALISAAVTGKVDVRGWQPPAAQ